MNKKVLFLIFAMVSIGSAAFFVLKDSAPDLVWTMVNVNHTRLQGDAHLIEVKNGKTILIDAGYLGPAKEKLIPYLQNRKIDIIDIAFISHPHRDHYEGLLPILEAGIEIETIYFNIPDKRMCDREIPWGCNYQQILEYQRQLRRHDVIVKSGEPGMAFDLGNNATIKILHAFDGIHTPVGNTDINDLSLIMMLQQNNRKILFTGDLNQKLGGWLAKSAEIQADILKVPHHGTEGVAPNSFFEAVSPNYALVPSPKQLWCSKRSSRIRNWFARKNTPVFVNGFHGHVSVKFTESGVEFIPEIPKSITCN
jgi:competence protein ComEC